MKTQPLPGRLALDHLHLVQPIAARLKRRLPESADLDDLAASGRLGLVRFAGRFDPSRGVPFEVPARKWIRGHILHSVQGARVRDLKHASLDDNVLAFPEPRSSAFSGSAPDPERAAITRDQWARVLAAVDRLSPLRRAIIQLRHFDGLEMSDIAAQLGLSSTAACGHRMRAIADLRRMLHVSDGPPQSQLKRAA